VKRWEVVIMVDMAVSDDHLPSSFEPPNVWRLMAERLRPKPAGPKRQKWLREARPNQLPPAGTWWGVWFILAGRGWGKTRTGAEHVVEFARQNPGAEIGVIGRTDAEARRILLNGPSGILKALEPGDLDLSKGAGKGYVESTGDTKLWFANGAVIYVVGANSPDALRGLNLWLAWADELASWRYQQVLWDEVLEPAVRLPEGPDGHPHILVTTTPRPTKLIRTWLKDEDTVVVRGNTFENVKNLAGSFIKRMRRKEGTRAGRQELYAEILDDVPGALLSRAVLDGSRVEQIPRGAAPDWNDEHPVAGLREVILALDPSDGNEESDEEAWAEVGLGWDHELYVTDTGGMREGTTAFLRMAVKRAHLIGATIVVEKNHGGKYLVETLKQIMRDEDVIVPFKVVRASEGKRTRAEPIAPLFEQGHAHMVGEHVDVEDQLTSWTGKPGERSPDRLDALVWAMSHFLGHQLAPEDEDDREGVYRYDQGTPEEWGNDGQDYAYG
jgi:phage terminase large subunit-like protein